MKKLLFIMNLTAVVLLFNACTPGYVSVRPSYYEAPRPPRPSSNHIWIGDSWLWNSHEKTYKQNNGHWSAPRKGRSYQQGEWKSSPKGNHWVGGRWR